MINIEEIKYRLDLITSREVSNVLHCDTDKFADLLALTSLDIKKDFRFSDLSYVDFGNMDLRGFDLTGSDLSHCKMANALLDNSTILTECNLDGIDLLNVPLDISSNNFSSFLQLLESEDLSLELQEARELSWLMRRPLEIGDLQAIGDKYARGVRYVELVDRLPQNPFVIGWLVLMSRYSKVDRIHITEILAKSFSSPTVIANTLAEILLCIDIPHPFKAQTCAALFSQFSTPKQRTLLADLLISRGVTTDLVDQATTFRDTHKLTVSRSTPSSNEMRIEGQGLGKL